MSYLVAIEGADGAGKATAAENVRRLLLDKGVSVKVISFPRYRETVGGFALGEFLGGRIPVPVTPQSAAVLYALDRLESRTLIEDAQRHHDIVIFDRYTASNVAYQAAKVAHPEAQELMNWIIDLETVTFGIPKVHLNVYLDTPLETAMTLMAKKNQRSYTHRAFDKHEADLDLQLKVRENYRKMADNQLLGHWTVVATLTAGKLREPRHIAAEIVNLITESRGSDWARRYA